MYLEPKNRTPAGVWHSSLAEKLAVVVVARHMFGMPLAYRYRARTEYRCRELALSSSHIRSVSNMADESFELFDLKVEVICPPGEKIYCGAKEGDHFFLRGEMLHLPEGQGFSIYSLCE